MSNYAEDEKTRLILLENALKDRNQEIRDLKEKLEKADKEWKLLNLKTKRLEGENKRLVETLKSMVEYEDAIDDFNWK